METAIIIPMYGKHELTDALLEDISSDPSRSSQFVIIIDNLGDYANPQADLIYVPPGNLGWLKSVNCGVGLAYALGFDRFIFMDNDVRLSPNFVLLMNRDYIEDTLMAPLYDDVWEQQRIAGSKVPARQYPIFPNPSYRRNIRFVDGTCQMLNRALYEEMRESADYNWLDERYFSAHGWGADFDLGIRMKNLGREIVVTERAYLNHLRGTTNKSIKPNYEGDAGSEMHSGMHTKYGSGWNELIVNL